MGKMIVYQMLPRLWGNLVHSPVTGGELRLDGTGHFSDIDCATLGYLRDDLKVTHLWLTGVIRHATTESFPLCPASNPRIVKGRAGSPYAIVDYYDVNPYLADNPAQRLHEFECLLKRTHDSGLKALIDFVPNHVSRDYGKVGLVGGPDGESALLGSRDDSSVHWKPDNDFYYYPGQDLVLPGEEITELPPYFESPAKASGNAFSPSPTLDSWYETIRLNYCDFHTPTWDRMYSIVRYWCLKGVDGFRCDMVEMVPWQFMRWLIGRIKEEFPDVIFIAEVYQRDLYRLYIETVGFDYLYDKSGLYDRLRAIVEGSPAAREITWNWQFLGPLQPRMLNFLENHDEQRFASPFFGGDSLRAAAPLAAGLLFGDNPFMIYFGQEVGERGMDAEGFSGLDGRTTIFDWWSVASLRRLHEYVHDGRGLSPREEKTLSLYKSQLGLLSSLPADSKSFDLCYCNFSSRGFDPDRHFAFLRGSGLRAVLVVCNFSPLRADMEVNIPLEAISYLGLKETEALRLSVSVEGFGAATLPV